MANKYFYASLFTIVGISILYIIIHTLNVTSTEQSSLMKLFIVSFLLIIIFGTITYHMDNKKYKDRTGMQLGFMDWINNNMTTTYAISKRVLVGVGAGMVFGIINNLGLWFGTDALNPITPKGTLMKAGYGNIYANTLSAFLATFSGNIIEHVIHVGPTIPIWSNALGTGFGCWIGLYLAKFITGRVN